MVCARKEYFDLSRMADFPIPPYVLAYLPYLGGCLAVVAFVAISLPLSKKPIAGTKLRRQSIVAIVVASLTTFHDGLTSWELLLVLVIGGGFTAVYYANHLHRKRIADAIAAEKAAARKAQLASFLAEGESERL